ncbi:MAG: PIN domain-containing protein [Chloracidobacterium sp.]|nr:PIN domain-containing protein [Chloracidobacterium sp.]
MQILLDTDVALDFLLRREPFFPNANEIFRLNARKQITIHLASVTPVNIFYIGRKLKGREDAFKAVRRIVRLTRICRTDESVLNAALNLGISDFEDAVQVAAAVAERLDAIVTRNFSDFEASPVPVYDPTEFLSLVSKG